MSKLPLEGVRVIELSYGFAGPAAGQELGDLGAEVILLESLSRIRGLPKNYYREPSYLWVDAYVDKNTGEHPFNRGTSFGGGSRGRRRNKRHMTIELEKAKGKELFKRLIKVSDVFLENNGTELMEKLGFTYDVLSKVNPRLIMMRMPAWGNTGPYAYYKGWGEHLESSLGHDTLRGYPDIGLTGNSTVYLGDSAAPIVANFAVMIALHHRNKTGKGQLIELSQYENVLPIFTEALMDYSMNQRVQGTIGNRDIHGAAPCGCYRCKGDDKWVNITITSDEEWQGFCQVLGNSSWTKDERFADCLSRYQNQDELDKLVESWTQQHDNYEVFHLLQKAGVPAGPVMNERDVYNDPHIKSRDWFTELTVTDCGTHLYPGQWFKMPRTPLTVRMPAPSFGQDNEYVYKQIIGVSDEEYVELEKEGHIGTVPDFYK